MDLAAIRPDDWNFPLLLHVAGAAVLVGAICLALATMAATWRGGSVALSRTGLRVLLWVALPAWIVMRVSAQWLADKQGLLGDDVPTWIGLGFMTSELSFLLIVIAAILAAVGLRRGTEAGGAPSARDRVALILLGAVSVLYLVSIWAMTAKPI